MTISAVAARQYFLCLDMIDRLIAVTPDRLWREKRGGFVYWQQIFHALTGSIFWLRSEPGPFVEPYPGRGLHPELDGSPADDLSPAQLADLAAEVRREAETFFSRLGERLLDPSPLHNPITSLDVLFMQLRHLQYHIGCCNGVLRQEGAEAVEWAEFYG